MRLCNKRHIFFVLLLVASSYAVWAQAPATSQPPAKPEQQPSLSVDRDPIVSPDAADNQPVSPSNPNAVRPGTSLEHGERGGFTFRRDVDEVVLNASVLDDNGRIVNDLKQPSSNGSVALWVGQGTIAHFANLKITPP